MSFSSLITSRIQSLREKQAELIAPTSTTGTNLIQVARANDSSMMNTLLRPRSIQDMIAAKTTQPTSYLNTACNDVSCLSKALMQTVDPVYAAAMPTSTAEVPAGAQAMMQVAETTTATPPVAPKEESSMMPWLIGGALTLYILLKAKGSKPEASNLNGAPRKSNRKATPRKAARKITL